MSDLLKDSEKELAAIVYNERTVQKELIQEAEEDPRFAMGMGIGLGLIWRYQNNNLYEMVQIFIFRIANLLSDLVLALLPYSLTFKKF